MGKATKKKKEEMAAHGSYSKEKKKNIGQKNKTL